MLLEILRTLVMRWDIVGTHATITKSMMKLWLLYVELLRCGSVSHCLLLGVILWVERLVYLCFLN